MFNVKAKTPLRVLALDKKFFLDCSKDQRSPMYIEGLNNSIKYALSIVNEKQEGMVCLPICDFVIMKKHENTPKDIEQ